MFSHNGRISARQLMLLLLIHMFNVGILILPRICTQSVGRNGYILPLLAIPIGAVYLFFLTKVTEHFPGATLYEITEKLFSKGIAWFISLILTVKLIIGLGLELRLFGELISLIMLPRTPIDVIILVMVLAICYLAKSGIEASARMGEVTAYFIFIPLVIILLVMSTKADYTQIMPFFQTTGKDVCWGTGLVSLWFMPLEILLIITGLMRKPDRAFKAGVVSIIVGGIFEALFVLLTICTIGANTASQQLWPVITFLRSTGMQHAAVEKQEVIMLIIWIFANYVYTGTILCASSILLSRCCHYKRQNVFVLPLAIIIYFIALWPAGLNTIYRAYISFRYYFSIWFLLVIPLILFAVMKLRRVDNEK